MRNLFAIAAAVVFLATLTAQARTIDSDYVARRKAAAIAKRDRLVIQAERAKADRLEPIPMPRQQFHDAAIEFLRARPELGLPNLPGRISPKYPAAGARQKPAFKFKADQWNKGR